MFSESAELYDLIYAPMKDYEREADTVGRLIRRLNPSAATVLDAGCGTGEHARWLAAHGFAVDGLDLDPAFAAIAQRKHPCGRFIVADMCDFALPGRYDAVVCLFSAIGYVRTIDRLARALACFRAHLAPGGCILVEPWFAPGRLDPSRIVRHTGEASGVRVSRVARCELAGTVSRLHFDYEITDASGTRRANEIHELGLFTNAEMLRAFRDAGLEASYRRKGVTDRGLYVSRVAA